VSGALAEPASLFTPGRSGDAAEGPECLADILFFRAARPRHGPGKRSRGLVEEASDIAKGSHSAAKVKGAI